MDEPDKPPLDKAQRDRIIALLQFGVDFPTALRYVGAEFPAVFKQRQHDAGFTQQTAAAERHFEVKLLDHLHTFAGKHWNCAAWLLERRFPERYGKITRGVPMPLVKQMCQQFIDFVLASLPEQIPRQEIEIKLRTYVETELIVQEKSDATRAC